jgi:hypothetical protein
VLLGGVVAANARGLDEDLVPDLVRLTHQLERGHRIPQPRLRHRLQVDTIGLQRSIHRLHGMGEELELEIDDAHGDPVQQLLGAVYAAGTLPDGARPAVMATIRRAVGWNGPIGPDLIAVLAGFGRAGGANVGRRAVGDPVTWALDVLELVNGGHTSSDPPPRAAIQQRFRALLRDAHPDHGGEDDAAAARIADLTEARRILLA